ncbi:NAD(P)/FAD-dependent oxidoreductase [Allorhodopirellula heiligendammensis]|uniref:FAD-dependent oxidoreductase LodB n=1 Tax=Allorhodopirellula heiligendammensis TaxID=2714739 RepID=A0A5C6CAZ2_9BACT|nr:NAD(P)/FAD-dependent oxidoreductase [Allorhodopirellula heiligendammensis]TWU19979.1 putative FAD-dependent oxidoreductase LodB [Allorhodopirellula heiligendammensis]
MNVDESPDVVVIGGGPSGATVSTLIAQQGYRVTLLEREHFPRYHIGESLIPETYWVLKRLGMLDRMKSSSFIKKYSVQFVSPSGKHSAPFYFHDNKPHECSQTWQIQRSEFDVMMLDNAREQGVVVHEGARVLDVMFEGDRAVGVQVKDESGNSQELRAKVVVDASGQSALLGNKFKLKISDPALNKGALWTYFKGAYRDEGKDEGATIVLSLRDKKGWFWYIPMQDDIVSVGVVADFDYLFKGRSTHDATYAEEMDNCPAVKERIASAEQMSPVKATKDYTYRASQAAGDGWVLVGDAFGFLDPLYSSGVLLALKSGELAADAIIEGLQSGDTSRAQLGKWEAGYVEGMNRMRRLVCEYYDGFNFGEFIRRFPHHRGSVTDLLIGDLFKTELDSVFDDIDTMKPKSSAAS